jgi:methylated-DNA-protein-cysteine methyltransferase-like protein
MTTLESSKAHKQKLIWQVIQAVPYGKVATYGQVAKLAGLPGLARFVGVTLKQLPEGSKLPWHRVINSQGRISFPVKSDQYKVQVELLMSEGITFKNSKISLQQNLWYP